MDIPDNPRDITEPQRCPRCEYTWDVLGLHEHGNWNPYNEDDLICDGCGKNLMEEDGMKERELIEKAVQTFEQFSHKSLVESVGNSVLDFESVRKAIDDERIIAEDFHKRLCTLSDAAAEIADTVSP